MSENEKQIDEKNTQTTPENSPGRKEKKTDDVRRSRQESSVHSLSFVAWIKIILVNIAVTVGLLAGYHHWFSPQIATVDLSGYLAGLRNLYLQGKINDLQLRSYIDEAISTIQRESGKRIILSAEVVLGNNTRVRRVSLPRLPEEAYNFNLEDYLRQSGLLREQKK